MMRGILPAVALLVLCSYSFPEKSGPKNFATVPADGAVLQITPPGFTWWRAGGKNELTYRAFVYDGLGHEVLSSPEQVECAWKPSVTIPEGSYRWEVKAYDRRGKEVCSKQFGTFSIAPGASCMPLPDVDAIILGIPSSHPRALFLPEYLDVLRSRIKWEKLPDWERVRELADLCLDAPFPPVPEFASMPEDTGDEFARKRIAYAREFMLGRRFYIDKVESAALFYLVTRDRRYGEAAKRQLLDITKYEVAGENSPVVVFRGNFDEFTMSYADCLCWAYDWTYDIFTPEEREKMEAWMVQLGDALSLRLSPAKTDYLCTGFDSHSGRIPPILINFAITLSNHPAVASRWLRQALTLAMTSYPHWASPDGGWAEGIHYSAGYNIRLLCTYEALRRVGGPDLLDMPYFRNFPYFISYASSPVGENVPFGDLEDSPMTGRTSTYRSMISFLADKNGDGCLKWWAELFGDSEDSSPLSLEMIRQNLTFPSVPASEPENVEQSRFFKDTGIAAMHSDIMHPENDLVLLVKSSPFGSVSHSHMDQNSFWIMQGGKSLAISAGSRYPVASSPFHEQYTRQSLAHNTLLFGGVGQVPKSPVYTGRITDTSDSGRICYAKAEGEGAYKGVSRFHRHTVMIRPGIILILDDFAQDSTRTVDWLFHAREKLMVKGDGFVSCREDKTMDVKLFATSRFKISQTDEWAVPPKQGYEFDKSKDLKRQWHLDVALAPAREGRILAVMNTDPSTVVKCRRKGDSVILDIRFPDGTRAAAACSLSGEMLMDISCGGESLKLSR